MSLASLVESARERAITPRVMSIDIPKETPRYWMGGDAYTTHLLNAMSLMFPHGERMFMDAVRAYRDGLRDPRLIAQVKGFLGQEALHSREHRTMNRWLQTLGIKADKYEEAVAEDIARQRALRGPIDDLAVTCALEHFTAMMAQQWLTDSAFREQAAEPLRTLWTWHALEELDHKAVAFDVYAEVGGDYLTRVRWMLVITFRFLMSVGAFQYYLLKGDKKLAPAYLAKSWWKFWGPRGHFSKLLPTYLRYFKPGFHPWQEDDRALIAEFERVLKAQPDLTV
ncbi:MAG: metal-dependent hydrolase [Polyangiales bacterium]